VAALVAAGRTNREVAEALVITEATAEVHVKHILSKLGFKSRLQVAVWAAERGLPTSMSYQLVRRGQTDPEPRSGSRDNRQ
jgi:predicted transcriptional regulator